MESVISKEANNAGIRLGVLTSGGDSPGMNAAVRAVVRTTIAMGAVPYAIREGWQGAVDGGEHIQEMKWSDVSGILAEGGTILGTARSRDFREYSGRLRAAYNLLEHGIDRLVVIGGDGSLTGANQIRQEWPQLLQDLVDSGEISADTAAAHPALMITGLVGSIDNDLVGTDNTIGADSALHRIVDAIDELVSTAASHQRTFVIEVMGRHCGYLPLVGAIAGGCDYVFIPENPPEDGWEEEICDKLRVGRQAGRRESLILVAEGAQDRQGNPISAQQVADVLTEKLNEDVRVTLLGHVQRGGSPSAYDRSMATLLGYVAVQELLAATADQAACIFGMRHNRVARLPLLEAVAKTQSVAGLIAEGDYQGAIRLRGSGFQDLVKINRIMSEPPGLRRPGQITEQSPFCRGKRVAIIHGGGLAPGMNTAARAAVRFGIDKGFTMLGVEGSFKGLIDGKVSELDWSDVEGWILKGGAELGTKRAILEKDQLYALGRAIDNNDIDALLVIGGFDAYLSAARIVNERPGYSSFNIPIICVPASIDNNLPGSELSIGADTALNNATWALDRIKESAAASRRCFVAETMGRMCGYLAVMAAISSGAETVYLNEYPLTLKQLSRDADIMKNNFEQGRRLFLVVCNEEASPQYNRDFLARIFEEEGGDLFDVRQTALGHIQQGGSPSPFDRNLATRLVCYALETLDNIFSEGEGGGSAGAAGGALYIGVEGDTLESRPIKNMLDDIDLKKRRPKDQWWLPLADVIPVIALPNTTERFPELTILED